MTRRQLRAEGLRPGGQPIAGQIRWMRYGELRTAYLYRLDRALPKRQPSEAQLASLAAAMRARKKCATCGEVKDYCIPHSLGECVDCHFPAPASLPVREFDLLEAA